MDNHNLIEIPAGNRGMSSSSLSKLSRDFFTLRVKNGDVNYMQGYISGDELNKLLNDYGYQIIELNQENK